MIYGFEHDPAWEESWEETGYEVDEFNTELGNAQYIGYYPAGYYPTETWNNEESWGEEVTEETITQNEQGQNSEAQKEEAGSVQGGEFCSLEKGHTHIYDLCELKTATPKVVPPPKRGVIVPPPVHGGEWQKVPHRPGNQPREIARVSEPPLSQKRLSIYETPNPWQTLNSTTSDVQSPEPAREHIAKALAKSFGKVGKVFGGKIENKSRYSTEPKLVPSRVQ